MDELKLNVGSLVALLLVTVAFFFALTCLDYLLMVTYAWKDPDTLYRYWIILWMVVIVYGFGLSFMGYVGGMKPLECVALCVTVVLLFAGGLLDQFYALLAFVQGQSYSFAVWSAFYKWGLTFWDWPEQIVWSAIFYGVIAYMWYRVLHKK